MVVEFRPGPGWRWVGFDGCVRVSAGLNRLDHEGDAGAVDEDLTRMAAQLLNKQYAAEQFDDTPGAVAEATVEVDRATLCHRTVIEGRTAASTDTTGTFRVVCRPSAKAGSPPTPDPQSTHEGTWSIRSPDSARTAC
jgi:hypothetical protein